MYPTLYSNILQWNVSTLYHDVIHATIGWPCSGHISSGYVSSQSVESYTHYRVSQCGWSETELASKDTHRPIKKVNHFFICACVTMGLQADI